MNLLSRGPWVAVFPWQRAENLRLSAHSCQVPHVLPRRVDPSLARRREEALDAWCAQLRTELGQLST